MTLPRNIPNPFRASVVADPWKSAEADVPDIHGAAFRECCEAVEHVRGSGSSAGLLIHGQAGSGKTHLLARLRQRLASGGRNPDLGEQTQVFVSVRLATSPARIWRHVRRQLVDDLLRHTPDGLSQLEHVLAARLAAAGEGAGDLGGWWEYMREERPDDLHALLYGLSVDVQADDALVTVLGHVVGLRHRREARSWLRGELLSEEALEKLGLAASGEENDGAEDGSKNVVLSLCRIAGAQIPIVFCFDQIEALDLSADGPAGLVAFGSLVAELHDVGQNAVLISCIQADYGPILKDAVPKYAYSRIISYANLSLAPLLPEQALALVTARLQNSPELAPLRTEHSGRTWPLTEQEIRAAMGEAGCTPRELLSFCAHRFAELQSGTAVPRVSDEEFLGRDWERRVEAALAGNEPEQTERILSEGLALLMPIAQPNWAVMRESGSRDIELVLAGQEGRVGVSLCTQPQMTSLAGRLRRLCADFSKARLEKLILIRDPRTPISEGAKKAREYLAELEKQDAVVCRPSVEILAALDALRTLLSDARSGDLSVEGRTIRIETVRDWLAHHLAEALREFAEQIVTPPQFADFDGEPELDRVMALLRTRHVGALSDLARELNCEPERLDGSIRRHPDQIGYLPGPPAVVFERVAEGAGET